MKSFITICLVLFFLTGYSQNQVRNTDVKYQPIAFNETDTYLLTPPISRVNINHPNVLIYLKSDIELHIDTKLESSRIQLVQDSIGGYGLSTIVCGSVKSNAYFIKNKDVGDITTLYIHKELDHLIIEEL